MPNAPATEHYARTQAFYALLAKLCSNWPEDYVQDRQKVDKGKKPGGALVWKVHGTRPHEPWRRLDGRVECALCGRASRSTGGKALLLHVRSPCRAGGAGGWAGAG